MIRFKNKGVNACESGVEMGISANGKTLKLFLFSRQKGIVFNENLLINKPKRPEKVNINQ